MFKVELRAAESLLVGKRQLTTNWQVHGQYSTQKQAEENVSWIINETRDYLTDLGRSVRAEYRITSVGGNVITTNLFS